MHPRTGILAAGCGALTALLLCSGLAISQQQQPSGVESYSQLRERFPQPAAEYRTLPFLVWNGDVTESEIDKHLAGFEEQGTGGVFIHPRPGMSTEYLSDRWFQLCRYTVEQGKKRGMQVWLYDENSYPSGFAGGHVPAQMPESFNEGQGLAPEKFQQLDDAARANYFVIAKGKDSYYGFTRVSYPKSAWHGGFSYVDLIRPGVTQKFIDVTMAGYEKALGPEFGKTVPGIFTDEPNINPPVRRSLRWTPDLFAQFEKRWGYDLKPLLPALYEETGDWRRVRHDYYGLLLELFIDRWSKPWRSYTDAKGLAWTGHYWEHAWPNPAQGPDNMAMYAWHQVPGIDMLFNQFREDVGAQFGNVRSVKELASVANQMGARRRLSETYGGGGWELRFEDMKRLGDWQAVLGVNMVNQHLAFGTIAGARKYDYPQSFTYHTPWWKHYRVLGDYFGRLSLALAAGEQVNRVLVIEPTTSAWMYASPGDANPRMMEIGRTFQEFVTQYESMQGEYDLGSENIMRTHGSVSGAKLAVGKRKYDVVVLPPGTESVDAAVAQLLEQYLAGGGTVVSFTDKPLRVDGVANGRMAAMAAKYSKLWMEAASLSDPAVTGKLLPTCFGPISGGKLFHQRRQLADGQVLFFANSSLEAPTHTSLTVKAGAVEQLDLFTGKAAPYAAVREGEQMRVAIDLAPGGSLLLAALPRRAEPVPNPKEEEHTVPATAPSRIARASRNVLQIDYCDLRIGGVAEERDLYFFVAQEKVFRHFGLGTNPWNHAVQYKQSILDRNHFPAGSRFEAVFHFDVDAGVDASRWQAVVERPALWGVAINGQAVQSRNGEWWLDRAFGVYDVGAHVRPGDNTLTLTVDQMSVHHEVEPVYLLGEFGVTAQERGWKLTAPAALELGAWKQQRLPFYFGEVSYSRTVQLAGGRRDKVRLGKWGGTVAEVRVNGKSAGVIGWQPYERDISAWVKPGANQIEVVVTGSLKNLLGPHHGQITRGLTGPGSFRAAPAHTPPGSGYDLEPYGLMEDFQVLECGRN